MPTLPDSDPDSGPNREPRDPSDLDKAIEPILVDMCKVVAFSIRDSLAILLEVVTIDIGYRVANDPHEQHMRLQMQIDPEMFEESYMDFATKRLLDDAKNIVAGIEDVEDDDTESE